MSINYKKLLFALLLFALLYGCKKTKRYIAAAPQNPVPVIIDGLPDNCWGKASWQKITEFVYDKKITPRSIGASFKVMWDNKNCYMFFNISDNLKYRRKLSPDGLTAKLEFFNHLNENDCIILYFFTKGYVFGQGHHTYFYHFIYNFNQITVGPTVEPRYKKAIKFAQHDTPTGYAMELSIPWQSMAFAPAVGTQIGFKAWVVDNDGLSIEPGVLPYSESALSWSGAETFYSRNHGNINLVQ